MTSFGRHTLLLPIGVLLCGSILAADLNFQGVLIEPPPCTISNGDTIEVDFGSHIGVNSVDGATNRHVLDYHLTCDVNSSTEGLTLKLFTATPAVFDSSAVQTSLPGLGIRLLWNGEPANFDRVIQVDPVNMPVLEGVPVKSPGITLSEGQFEAYVTLQVIYQ